MKIGSKIKNLRICQRVTLKELAKKTDLSASFLSQLERDLVSPSICSLEKVAEALNTKAGYFFEREENKELVLIKKGSGRKIIVKEKKISIETLASGLLNIKMQPQVFTLGVKAELSISKDLIYTAGEKFGIVLKGRLEFLCDEKKLILEEGDSIYCAYTQKPQRITNISKTESKFLWITFVSS